MVSVIAILLVTGGALASGGGLRPIPGQRGDTGASGSSSSSMVARLEPSQSDWDSEVFAEAAARQLDLLADRVQAGLPVDATFLKRLAAPDAAATTLRPPELKEVFSDRSIRVSRSTRTPAAGPAGPVQRSEERRVGKECRL